MRTRRKLPNLFFGVLALATAIAIAGAYAIKIGAVELSQITQYGRQYVTKSTAKSSKAFRKRAIARTSDGALMRPQNPLIPQTSLSSHPLITLAAGDLDTTFDGDGKVTTQMGGEEDVALSVVLQPDGKIVCAGYSATGTGNTAFVLRYNSDGSLDSSFDGDGKVTESFGVGFTTATSVALQSDGKILVAGYTRAALPATTGFDFFLLRYNSNGTLDTTFDGDGKMTTDFASFDEADSLFIQADGKIIVVGNTNNNTLSRTFAALARYNSDGSLDPSFGTGGKVLGHEGAAFSVLVQPDGQIVTGGWGCATSPCTQNLDYTFARYNTDGSLDPSFGTGGKAIVAVSSGRDEAHAIALQADGKILASGVNLSSANSDPIAVVRLNTDGTLDTSFGTNGIVQNLAIVVEDAFGLALQANGKIVTGGRVYNSATDSDFAVVRLNTDGTLDTTFGGGGIGTTAFTNNLDGIINFAIQGDGKIVAVGFAENQVGNIDAAVARYLGISTVSVSGRVTTPDGRGLRSATVKLTNPTDPLFVPRTVTTSSGGFYSFDNVQGGPTYTITVSSKLYRFAARSVPVSNTDVTGVDFLGQE